MKKWDSVAIVGVGLIGGSIGLTLRKRGLTGKVIGIGRRASSLRKARAKGAVTTTTTNIARGVADAELIVVCTPVERVVDHVCQAAEACPAGALITDAGSTKAQIVAALDGSPSERLLSDVAFVGSHPLAGSEKTGPQFAREDLFDSRICIVTPTRRTGPRDFARTVDFWSSLGSTVVKMTPREHDEAVAAVSHVPHVVASILAGSTPKQLLSLVSTGWLDATRIAAGDVELWRQILATNRSHVLKSLAKFEKVLTSFRAALESENDAKVAKLLKTGKDNRDAVGS